MNIGKLGVWAVLNTMSAAESVAFTRRVEAWGYSTLWIPEAVGGDPMVAAAWALAHSDKLHVATGIANVYARDSVAMVAAQNMLAERSGGRFALGLGVSHALLVEHMRGHVYQKPLGTMRHYLQAMKEAFYLGPLPAEAAPTLIAALGPKMLALAAESADGVLTYNATPSHTAQAREILGAEKSLCVEQMVVLESDPEVARCIARNTLCHSLALPNYRNHFLRLGFQEVDLDDGGSKRFIDAMVAYGDIDAIRERVARHWASGADHVCVQVLPRQEGQMCADDEQVFAQLAPALQWFS